MSGEGAGKVEESRSISGGGGILFSSYEVVSTRQRVTDTLV